jgi:hypothetical protein
VNVIALRDHATAVAHERLRRPPRQLRRLEGGDRRVVEELGDAVAQALVDLLVEEAEQDAALAAALTSIYGAPPAPL